MKFSRWLGYSPCFKTCLSTLYSIKPMMAHKTQRPSIDDSLV